MLLMRARRALMARVSQAASVLPPSLLRRGRGIARQPHQERFTSCVWVSRELLRSSFHFISSWAECSRVIPFLLWGVLLNHFIFKASTFPARCTPECH